MKLSDAKDGDLFYYASDLKRIANQLDGAGPTDNVRLTRGQIGTLIREVANALDDMNRKDHA